MILNIQFEIPKNTPKATPKLQNFNLGVNARSIKNIIVKIPQGHRGLAFLQVNCAGQMLIPSQGSSMDFINGEKQDLSYSFNQTLDFPYTIFCKGYNNDILLPHSFFLDIEV